MWPKIFGSQCLYWRNSYGVVRPDPEPFSLPAPLPVWPDGTGFAAGRILIGEIEIVQITKFDHVWSSSLLLANGKGVSFYKPRGIPDGFFIFGHYCQTNDKPLYGYILVGRDNGMSSDFPALKNPTDYLLLWSTDSEAENAHSECAYFWLPLAPDGYKAMGCLVSNKPHKPSLDDVRCVRLDLTAPCENHCMILNKEASKFPCQVWSLRPCERGVQGKGISIGTFNCITVLGSNHEPVLACLRNLDQTLLAMPNIDQVQALIKHYGPTICFHPDEIYFPSSVSWFFKNGAVLCRRGSVRGESIDAKGSILPCGGKNDGEYWIDLPGNDPEEFVKKGDIEAAELYVHVKPALGGTCTDIVMWIFCPFNGPATLKVGMLNFEFSKIGQHVGDWEHFTLRVSNFNGQLWSIYFSQHSGGEWVEAWKLEYTAGNKAIVYSSKSGHASFPHPGNYLQGSWKLGIGIRNDAAKSNFIVDASIKYKIVSAEYLAGVSEPPWLQYMREWGPTIVYNSRSELDKILSLLPVMLRFSVENIFDRFPLELYGEEGPTGPKEKDNWEGDERDC